MSATFTVAVSTAVWSDEGETLSEGWRHLLPRSMGTRESVKGQQREAGTCGLVGGPDPVHRGELYVAHEAPKAR